MCERGTLSDDGDKVVDKHSGFTIKEIQMDTLKVMMNQDLKY